MNNLSMAFNPKFAFILKDTKTITMFGLKSTAVGSVLEILFN